MPTPEAIRWFKTEFQTRIEAAIRGTPFTVDLLTAIACQETGHIWNTLRKKMSTAEVLKLCVGDTLDADRGRKAFPQTKADLVAKPKGEQMFQVAHQALVDMAKFIPGFAAVAKRPNKFCHGFGIFQYDLQFFLVDPDFFLEKRWADFDASLGKAMGELKSKRQKIGLGEKAALTDLEMVSVAIAYNTGGFKPAKGLKQGHFDGSRFYGEAVFDYLRLSRTVSLEGAPAPGALAAVGGTALLPAPAPVAATGAIFEVDVRSTPLNVRSEPWIPATRPESNIVAKLPDGHLVRAVNKKLENGFLRIETSLSGAHIAGFASAKFLEPAPDADTVPVETPSASAPAKGIVAVHAPRKAGVVTRRTAIATAHSLNESGQPGRKGKTAAELRAELAAIIDWLGVDKHKRYLPREGLTFCNIYTHDYCFLAGAFLPRVWWTPGSIEKLAQGKQVEPRLGSTIEEMRANNIFRWLRDFGMRFGWRQTGTLTKLQTEVNQGALGLIIARRVVDGRSGHMVMVVPETAEHSARRNTAGEVIAPLQSQAGASNFRYGTGTLNWWKHPRFAEFAFWLHP
jgi:hypothetical protein